ncbi:ribosome recycling factor [Flexilinea flocculi]|jgi:ribosome recycling factor|uniref:Ribosome-recycling factor n=1 Tax=Flexilinea flocculi TaxID=1678840 RepID=A0A0K8PAQ8_9CHLR|nr:ribosome recycling factor [Flexilinea flocculi]NMB92735.1 ribosome recycling factor [Flexilinea flocculi]GAP39230.1 ribosome recycling factor [Flexilinea flocculi]
MINEVLDDAENRMKSAIKVLEDDLEGIRTGRATPTLVEKLIVEYYGMPTPFNQVSTISIPDARTILIRPFESSLIKAMEKSIQASELGLTPSNDGKSIRLMLPPLTEERRRDLMKVVNNRLEDARVAIRNIRRDVIKDIKDFEKEKMISEDDRKKGEEKIQKLIDQYIAQIDEVGRHKEKEIMEV